jgi:hypothetical protein
MHGNGYQFNVDANPFPLELFFYFFKKELFFIVYDMISESPGSKEGDETYPICNKTKSKHLSEDMFACSRKIQESQEQGNDK